MAIRESKENACGIWIIAVARGPEKDVVTAKGVFNCICNAEIIMAIREGGRDACGIWVVATIRRPGRDVVAAKEERKISVILKRGCCCC